MYSGAIGEMLGMFVVGHIWGGTTKTHKFLVSPGFCFALVSDRPELYVVQYISLSLSLSLYIYIYIYVCVYCVYETVGVCWVSPWASFAFD